LAFCRARQIELGAKSAVHTDSLLGAWQEELPFGTSIAGGRPIDTEALAGNGVLDRESGFEHLNFLRSRVI
jgi:hypothetical protein